MNFSDVPYRFPARSVVVDGFRLAYVDVNSEAGDPVVCLHDLGGDLDDFGPVYEAISSQRRVLGMDLVGFGKSDKPPLDEPVWLYGRLLAGFVDALDLERVSIVGHGLGALVAALLAIEHPDRVGRLVLSAPPGFPTLDEESLATAVNRYAFDYVTALDDEGRRSWFEAATAGWNDRLEALLGVRNALAVSLGFRPWARALEAVAGGAFSHGLADRVGEIAAPTLVVWGVDDPITPFAGAASLHDAIPGARLVAVEECGHMPMHEQPEVFGGAVATFLGESDEGAGSDTVAVETAVDIEPWPGLTPGVGRVARLLFAERERLAELTAGLSVDDVAWRSSAESASVGDLILGTGARVARQLYEVLRAEVVPTEVINQFRMTADAPESRGEAPKKSAGRLLAEVTSAHDWLAEWLSRRNDADLNRTFASIRGGAPVTLRWILWDLAERNLVDRGRIAAACESLRGRGSAHAKIMYQASSDVGS